MTVVSGISGDEIENVTKNLKNMLACGGTHKDDTIELQGNHKEAGSSQTRKSKPRASRRTGGKT